MSTYTPHSSPDRSPLSWCRTKNGMKDFDETSVNRDQQGRFADKVHAPADVELLEPVNPKSVEFVNSARLLQHATNMVRLHLSKAGIENHDRYLEDIAQEVSIAAWNQAHTVRNMPAYVNTAAAGHVRKFFRPKDRDSTDELATSIHLEEIERFELANDREMTRPERNALAEDIRENWDDWRSGRGKKGRKPRKKFHTYYEDKPQAISIDELPVEKPQDEYEEAVKTLERQRGIIGSINIADRRAARAYTEASRKLADQMGRELHPTEEDMLAKMIRKKWD